MLGIWTAVAGVALVGTALAGTALAAGNGAPAVKHIGAVAPDILAVQMTAREVVPGRLQPYIKQEDDEYREDQAHKQAWLVRGGRVVGALAGPQRQQWWNLDRVVGENIDTTAADEAVSFTLRGTDAPLAAGVHPLAVHRKSKPSNMARVAPWSFDYSYEHTLYLKLPAPLGTGQQYELDFGRLGIPAAKYVHDPAAARSEAVHVNHAGFRPDDPAKRAYLSCWMGSGGGLDYPTDLSFSVIDTQARKAVFTGKATLGVAKGTPEDAYNRNHNGTNVYWLDFAAVKEPGEYVVSVDGIGCSYPFRIAEDVYGRSFYVSARGFYHQRSGIELRPPYTTFTRPRCFHPDDGVVVYASTCTLLDSGNGLNAKGTDKDNFGNLVRGATTEVVPDAWGGYFDAGDWDRRIQHLDGARYLLELMELFPDHFAGVRLNTPETGNGLPDVVNEALWGLDVYRRMQTADGGIRGGIEQSEHPWAGETSWLESKPKYAYAPDEWCSYIYAADAARAAIVLRTLRPELAREYERSAVRAFGFAEGRTQSGKQYAHNEVRDRRNNAALELWRLTGDAAYHRIFLETTVFTDAAADVWVWQKHDQRDAAFTYARIDLPGQDATVKFNARGATVREALAQPVDSTGFNWTNLNKWGPVQCGTMTTPRITLARAHFLSQDPRILRELVLDCQSGLGANPLNISYTIGIGHDWPKNPLICDARIGNLPPFPGITVYGPADPERMKDDFGQKLAARATYPDVLSWPAADAYFDIFMYPITNEFTVMQSIAPQSYAMGYLAARK